MLQAMNTGHDGSLTTVHANSARDALHRLEMLVLMAGVELPMKAVREQIAGGFDLLVHISRLVDGSRRVTQITEIAGMEGDVITLQDLFVARAPEMTDGWERTCSSRWSRRSCVRASFRSSRRTASSSPPRLAAARREARSRTPSCRVAALAATRPPPPRLGGTGPSRHLAIVPAGPGDGTRAQRGRDRCCSRTVVGAAFGERASSRFRRRAGACRRQLSSRCAARPLREAKAAARQFLAGRAAREPSTGLVAFGHEALVLTAPNESIADVSRDAAPARARCADRDAPVRRRRRRLSARLRADVDAARASWCY